MNVERVARARLHCAIALLFFPVSMPAQSPAPVPSAPAPNVIATPAPTSSAQPMTLGAAQRAALEQVSALRQAEFDEAAAVEDVRQARAALLPRLRDAFTITYNSPERGSLPAVPSFIAANAVHEYENLVGVAGELNVGLYASIRKAHAMLDAARAGTAIARRALRRGVTEAYYGAALAQAKRAAAESSLSAAEEFERVTRLGVEAGEAPEVDLIRARLQTAARREDLLQAREAEAVANAQLSILLGLGVASTPSIEPLPQTIDTTPLVDAAPAPVMARPEIARVTAEAEAARADIAAARGDLLPRITYSLDRGFDSDSLIPEERRRHRGTLATASIDVPLFDWGATISKIRQAGIRARAANAQRELTIRELEVEALTARQEAETAAARVDNAHKALDDAERNVTISIARYRAGEAPISEATDAQTMRAQERLALQQALYDYQIAIAHLREARGE